MADISKITLPSGSEYNLKDSSARAEIENIKGSITGAMHFLGVTTTALTDGSLTNPITIAGESVTAIAGNVVIYGELEFVFSGSDNKWHEYGSTGSLKALAFKNNASGNYTPSGNVSKPSFTGNELTSSGSYTPDGTIQFTNSNTTATVSKAASGAVTYTPEGTVTPTVTLSNTTVNSITDVGTLPTCTMPSLSTTVVNENLTFIWTDGQFTAGTLPTKGENVSVATGVESATATFSGTGARLVTSNISVPTSADFTGTEATVSVKGTPSGDVSQPTFTGSQDTVTVS